MKLKTLLFLFLLGSTSAFSQYTTGTVNLTATGMTIKLDINSTTVTMTLTGDSSSMLGIGFGNDGMLSGDDGYIYNSSTNRDYTFIGPGSTPNADASQDWTQVSNTVSGSTRTVVAQRSLSGGSGDFAFTNDPGTIEIYYARRSGNLNIGNHGTSLRGYATLNKTLGVNDLNASEAFMIYPNPATKELNFKNFEKIKSISILDANGRIITPEKEITEKIDISDLQSGIYFVEIVDNLGKISYQKIIKK